MIIIKEEKVMNMRGTTGDTKVGKRRERVKNNVNTVLVYEVLKKLKIE